MIAMTYPAHVSCIEKTAALFGHVDLIDVGEHDPVHEGKLLANKDRLTREGQSLDFTTRWLTWDEADWSAYDVLIDYWEARRWAPSWKERSTWLVGIPRIVKISWFKPDTLGELTEAERNLLSHSVVSTDSQVAAAYWQEAGVDAHCLYWYPGDWWFNTQWTGEDKRLLFILSGAWLWRGGLSKRDRFWLWHELTERWNVPGYHLDGGEKYRTSLEMADEVSRFAAHVNLDMDNSARHLCLAFTETLAAGLPQLIIRRETHDYHRFVEDGVNGYVCADLTDLVIKARLVLDDDRTALRMSLASRDVANEHFSREVLRSQWDDAITRAQELHQCR